NLPTTVARSTAEVGLDAVHSAAVVAAAARLLARTYLYATAMGRLSAEERLATLLCDIALDLGRPAAGGHAFAMPLARRDRAGHLALNSASVSGLMTRLKSRGLLSMPTRSRAIAKDLEALIAITPFGGALREMAARAPTTSAR